MDYQIGPLKEVELLDVWERGQGQIPAVHALLLLAVAFPGDSYESLASLSVGLRDDRLLALRRWLFGPDLENMLICPACNERLELAFDMSNIHAPPLAELEKELQIQAQGYQVRFRLPNALDLVVVQQEEDARQTLLQRCILSAYHGEQETSVADLPVRVIEEITKRMDEADPQADIRFPVTCPECEQSWSAHFDIVRYLWQELTYWAISTLGDVHILAAAYGWPEKQILTISPWRRRYYIDMVLG